MTDNDKANKMLLSRLAQQDHTLVMKQGCTSCGSYRSARLADRLRDGRKLSVVACIDCGLGHIEPLPRDVETYYEETYSTETGADIQKVRERATPDVQRRCVWLKEQIRTDARVLDVGCGSGAFLIALDSFLSVRAEGVEIDRRFRERLRQERFVVYTALAEAPQQQYDVILLSHVLEHVETPVKFLRVIRKLLTKEGFLYIEVPCLTDPLLWAYKIPAFWDFYWQYPHIWYFAPLALERLLNISGYTVTHTRGFQRYGLSNHLQWLSEGAPGPGENFAQYTSEAHDLDYRKRLVGSGYYATLWLQCRVSS